MNLQESSHAHFPSHVAPFHGISKLYRVSAAVGLITHERESPCSRFAEVLPTSLSSWHSSTTRGSPQTTFGFVSGRTNPTSLESAHRAYIEISAVSVGGALALVLDQKRITVCIALVKRGRSAKKKKGWDAMSLPGLFCVASG